MASSPSRLDPTLARWWFDTAPGEALARSGSVLARRDAVLLRGTDRLPAEPEWGWAQFVNCPVPQVLRAALLFDLMALAQPPRLDLRLRSPVVTADRRWVVSTASILPFPRRCAWNCEDEQVPAVARGICELKRHCDVGFEGLWARWARCLDDDLADAAQQDRSLTPGPSDHAAGRRRALRAWSLCLVRAEAGP